MTGRKLKIHSYFAGKHMNETITLTLSIWGAVLSTVLFVLKINEVLKNSFRRLKVDLWTDTDNPRTVFFITNFSDKAVNIKYFEVFFSDKKSSKDRIDIDSEIVGNLVSIHIEPRESFRLIFEEIFYFDPYHKRFEGKKLFIKLFEAGTGKTTTKRVKI
jgi:hypothetical protein